MSKAQNKHKVKFGKQQIEVEHGSNLRRTLLNHKLSPYNGLAAQLNCRGMGTCGTCSVKVCSGEVSPKTSVEKWRLNFPPHRERNGLRLSCQCQVLSDLEIEKMPGFWGEKVD